MFGWRFITISFALAAVCAPSRGHAQGPPPATGTAKNWMAPAGRSLAQALSDETMSAHPELLSVTFHGNPPGSSPDVYTMFAGSYPDRIGNPDDPDDIDVSKKGITIVDPRWHRTHDSVAKFVVLEPLRDRAGDNIGLIVYAFRRSATKGLSERDYFDRAVTMRDGLASRIPSFEALFAPVR